MRSSAATQALVVATFTFGVASAAHGTCAAPAPQVVWSYPSADEVVPLTASFWVLGLGLSSPGVEVLEVGPATTTDSREFTPPALEADGSYELLFTGAPWEEAEGEPFVAQIPFATLADAPLPDAPSRPVVDSHSESETEPDWTDECRAVFHAVDCYDTDQNTYVTLDVDQTPLLWLVRTGPSEDELSGRSFRWPGECGPPVHFAHRFPPSEGVNTPRLCYELVAVDEHGQRSPPTTYCTSSDPDEPSAELPLLGGCTSTAGGMPLWAALLALGLIRRRHGRSS